MCTIILLTLFSLSLGLANSATTFDQRQTGESNVQVDLKHLQIIALLKGGKEEYVDYDYAYDYSEMTIKPQNGITTKPFNGTSATDTVKDNSTVTVATTLAEQTTLPMKYNDSQTSETTEVAQLAINDSTTTVKSLEIVSTQSTIQPDNINVTSTPVPVSSTPSCKKGFVVNQKGDCELKLQGTGNALLKLVKLGQKLKLRRENRSDDSA